MGDTTPLSLPADLPYPITITRLCAAAGDQVHRGDKLLEYSFTSATRRKEISDAERNGKPLSDKDTKDDMVGSWESPIDGQVVSWMTGVQVRAKIEQRRGT